MKLMKATRPVRASRRITASEAYAGKKRKKQLERICNDLGYYLEAIKRKIKTTDEYALELDGMSASDIDDVDSLLDKLESIDTTALDVILDEYL